MKPNEDCSAFDRMRAWSEGSMPGDERARFEAEMARDPELARSAADFRSVWSATAAGLGAATTSTTTFEDVLRRTAPAASNESRWKRVAAAILFVTVVPLVWYAWKHHADAAHNVVKLRTIPLEPPTALEVAEHKVPPLLANWSPVVDGQISWLESMDDARAVSAAVKRPIFVYGYVADCPICLGFQRTEFKDPEVLALVDRAVPLRIDLMKLDETAMNTLMSRRYPLLEMQDDRGDIMRTFAGQFAEVDMKAELASVLKDKTEPSWPNVHELTNALMRARSAEASGEWTIAAPAFAALAERHDLPVFAEAGGSGLARAAAAALRTIEVARAGADARSAMSSFANDAAEFKGTPFEPDLDAVLEAWRSSGRFPMLEVQR